MALVIIILFLFQSGWMETEPDDPEAYASWLNDLALMPLDLNTVSADELARLPTLDPRLARAIVAHRTRRGAFRDISELERVSGIDAEHIEAIRPYVRISWRVRWNPTGAASLRHGQYRGQATAGPLSVFRSESRRFLRFQNTHATFMMGDHRVSTGLGLVQHQSLRPETSVFGHNRHGTRIRGNTSTSTQGNQEVAGTVRFRGLELSAFEDGGRIQLSNSFLSVGATSSAGAIGQDAIAAFRKIPITIGYEIGVHKDKTAFMAESAITPMRRFKISARYYSIGTGYSAPNALIGVKFGRKPIGESGIGIGVTFRGAYASVSEARSHNSLLRETDTEYRIGFSDARFLGEVRKRVRPGQEDGWVKGGVRFREGRALRGEVIVEGHNRGVGGRAVLDVRPAQGLRVWAMMGVFDAEAYDDRLYVWEPDGHRRGKVLLWYGRGRRGVVSIEAGPVKGVVLSGVFGVTHFSDRWGPGAIKSEGMLQVNVGF